jgi:hypothetical protein
VEAHYTSSNLWTSGSQLNCRNKFKWCEANTSFASDLPWVGGEPNSVQNNEACVAQYYNPGNEAPFLDLPCAASLNFICEVWNQFCMSIYFNKYQSFYEIS